jgi:hypothetical protein
MDIFILHDGQESGPHTEKAVHDLLQQGGIAETDLAWCSGMSDWTPLREVLASRPAAVSVETSPPAESTAKFEPATAKQKALLSYLGVALSADLSRDQAARLVNDAMEDPNNTERLALWNEERLRLHPELFATEIQAKKENRANRFFELCQTQGAEYFSGITKAHCQVLVGFLDVKFPHWDAREAEAAEHYFFPAVAEKFPQLVYKQWRGRLHYVGAMKVSSEIVRQSPTSKLRQSAVSPAVAISRGLVLGVFLLGVLYLGYRTMHPVVTAAPTDSTPPISTNSPPPIAPRATNVAAAARSSPAETTATAPQNLPPIEPVPTTSSAAPVTVTGTDLSTPVAMPATAAAAVPEAAMNPAPMAAVAPDPASPMAAPPMAPAAVLDPAMMAINSTALANAPMAALPGTEPPVPVQPPPATTPAPALLPSTPPAPVPSTPEAPATTSAAKTNLLLTKSVEIPLAYGKIMLPPGTAVRLVSRQGAILKVSYQNSIISVPVASTDLE